jgi:hypothetical protein
MKSGLSAPAGGSSSQTLMDNLLTKKEAIEFTGLDAKTFDNYFKSAEEFGCELRQGHGRFMFRKETLYQWIESYRWRTVELDLNDYILCLDFALAQHFRGYVVSDWSTARQREFGQKITNWIKGQLAEVAVKKFFHNEFDTDVELDFGIHENIVPQDIIGVNQNGTQRKPNIGIGIKASKPKSCYLILSENEISLPDRKSDVYIFCRPDIPDDHLLRITSDKIIGFVKNQQHFSLYKNSIPRFENILCEISGWCDVEELEKTEAKSIPGLEEATGYRYIKKSGQLHKDRDSWQRLLQRL